MRYPADGLRKLGFLGLGVNVPFHLAGPLQEAPQVLALAPDKLPEGDEADPGHLDAAVSFDPPAQVGTAPGREVMSASGVPEKTQHLTHVVGASIARLQPESHAKIRCIPGPAMSDSLARKTAEEHYFAALDLVTEGEHERALEHYEKALAADPTFTDAMHGLSRTLQDLGRLDEAIEVAARISEFDPDDVLAHTSLSVLYQKKGMIPEAEAEGNKARILGWKQQLKGGR
jgi:tetratricopeptide (TPR) repeat protein